jgi:hypothetical protein
MTTIESICNQTLDVLGYTRHIGNIYEGTKAARVLLDAWSETRDALLEKVMPDWSRQESTLVLLKSAPTIVNGTAYYATGWNNTYPAMPWLYEYQYPTDCITPMQIKSSVFYLPIWRPQYNPFRLNYSGGVPRTILTNVTDARLLYVAQVLDPNDWHNEFIEMMILALAKKTQPALMPHAMRGQQEQQGQREDASNSAG